MVGYGYGNRVDRRRPGLGASNSFLRGVNISGQDSGGSIYAFMSEKPFDYFVGKGARAFRLTMRQERMMGSTAGGNLQEPYATRYGNLVNYCLSKGARPIIDPHNFGRFRVGSTFDEYNNPVDGTEVIIGETGSYTAAHFADFWVKLSNRFSDPRIIYNLMNEPHDQVTATLTSTLNTAIAAIRSASHNNLLVIPFNGFSNRWGFQNDQVAQKAHLNAVVDPANNWVIDYHCYFDPFSPGNSSNIDPDWLMHVQTFTTWCRANGKKAFVGEYGVADTAASKQVLVEFHRHLSANSDVWIGSAWWTSVLYQDAYIYQLLPTELKDDWNGAATGPYTDKPQMALVGPYLQETRSAPVFTTTSVISGATALGASLSATEGAIVGYPLPTFSYQWKRNGTNISGATSAQYTSAQVGSHTRVITATNEVGSASIESNAIDVVEVVTLDPANKTTGVETLTNGNLTATHIGNGVFPVVRATKGIAAGEKKYFETTVTWPGAGNNNSQGVGLVNSTFAFDGTQASNPNGVTAAGDGGIYGNNAGLGGVGAAFAKSDKIRVAIDRVNNRIWFARGAGNWNNNSSANPETNVGGVNIAYLGAGTLYPIDAPYFASHTVNFGASAYTYAAPTGFGNL